MTNLEERMHMEFIDMNNVRSFNGRDVLRIGDFNRDEITYVLEVSRILGHELNENRRDLRGFEFRSLLEGLVVATDFGEDSSRTHDSSVSAATTLGAIVNPIRRNAGGTSRSKGESAAHNVAGHAVWDIHALIMRDKLEGIPQWLSDYTAKLEIAHPEDVLKPVIINGGDGTHEHPTQAFLDMLTLYTIYNVNMDGSPVSCESRDDVLSGLTMIAVGDTLKGRTFKSLARALSQFDDNEVVIVSPEEVRSPQSEIEDYISRGLKVKICETVEEALEYARDKDKAFVYGLRTQEERLDPKVFRKVKDAVYMTPDHFDMGESADILPIMHPLPMNKRHPEIAPEMDFLPNAKYIKEMRMGKMARMGLLGLTLGRVKTSADNVPYVDSRLSVKGSTFRELNVSPVNDQDTVLEALRAMAGGQIASRAFDELLPEMTSHPDRRADLFYDLLSRMTNKGELLELVRHLTFRFRDGEEGFVIDHIANGNTGLVKYNLDLSSLLGVGGCDENPVVVSAVDGLNSIKSADGLKGVIKVRGYLPPDEFFQYIGLLSDTMPTVTFIRDGKPVRKISPDTPYELRDFIHCPNVLCVSGEEFHEHVPTVFYHQNPDCDNGSELYACRYCDTPIHRKDFRLVKSD